MVVQFISLLVFYPFICHSSRKKKKNKEKIKTNAKEAIVFNL